jgi:hypothetical protein
MSSQNIFSFYLFSVDASYSQKETDGKNQRTTCKQTNQILTGKIHSIFLKKFLDAIVKHSIIKSSKLLFSFLTIEDKDEFSKIKSSYSKQSPPTILKDFENIDGLIHLKITSENDAKAKLINVTVTTYEELFESLNESFKNLQVEMETVSTRLKEISNIFYKIHQCSEISQDLPDTINTYKLMTNLTGGWGKVYETQTKVINDDLREFFRYVKKEMSSFKDVLLYTYYIS